MPFYIKITPEFSLQIVVKCSHRSILKMFFLYEYDTGTYTVLDVFAKNFLGRFVENKPSYFYFISVLRIREVYPGFKFFHPRSWIHGQKRFRIPDPDPHQRI